MPVVGGLAAVVLAVVALLICYGALLFGKMLGNLLPRHINVGAASIPFGSLIESAVNSALAGIEWVFGKWVLPAVAFVARPVIALLGWVQSIVRFAVTAAVQLQWITFTAIPEALSAAKSYAIAAASAVRAYAVSVYARLHALAYDLYHRATTYAHALYDSLHALAYRLFDLAKAYARAILATEVTQLEKAIHLARVYTYDTGRVIRSDLTRSINQVAGQVATIAAVTDARIAASVSVGVATAERYADQAATAAVGAITTDVTAALEGVWDGLIIDIGAVSDVLATDLPDIGDAVRAIPRAIPTDIAGAIALPLAISIPFLRYLKQCGIPNCRNLGGLGRFLSDLMGAAELGALLAMLTEMIHDPEGAARNTADELGDLIGTATGLAEDLLGV